MIWMIGRTLSRGRHMVAKHTGRRILFFSVAELQEASCQTGGETE
jgi:hypothetical protein